MKNYVPTYLDKQDKVRLMYESMKFQHPLKWGMRSAYGSFIVTCDAYRHKCILFDTRYTVELK